MYFNKHSYFVIIFKFFLHNNDFITNHLIPIVSFYKKKKSRRIKIGKKIRQTLKKIYLKTLIINNLNIKKR